MIVYNVTVHVELGISELWTRWMKEDHIPKVLETGCFTGYKFYRVMEEDQSTGMTYAVQYFAPDLPTYFKYQNQYAQALQKESKDIWQDKYTAFRTLLREI